MNRQSPSQSPASRDAHPAAGAAALMSSARLDALREVANIGAGHAATALSTLTGTRIMISVPMVNVIPPGDFVPEIAPEEEVVAVQMAMSGNITGRTIFLLPILAGLRLAERMLRRARGTSPSLGKLEQSALKEAGNILAGAHITALSEFLDMRLMLSPPVLSTGDTPHALDAIGDAGAHITALSEFLDMRLMLSPPVLSTGDAPHALDAIGDHAPRSEAPILCVETEFFLEDPAESLHGFFLLVPDSDAFDAIFRAVRVA